MPVIIALAVPKIWRHGLRAQAGDFSKTKKIRAEQFGTDFKMAAQVGIEPTTN